ncbi:ankyrin repeat domain-containing protein SOWAHC [Zootoca vivipara]|uniref:ankyrin repeat domain-containing protein SOWAHC n=1 Tax=Zootoca vivipara TaxID=8524 RepID=UPI00293B9898|nr:ankyrin repeat domain-containing protein SOWAHC [Zootoca vivipara]
MAAAEPSQDAVLQFLSERGGRARNADLLDHFRGYLNSPDQQRRSRARERFKEMVNAVATVRQEPGSGAKYVQLRKKYRVAVAVVAAEPAEEPGGPRLPPEPGGDGEAARREAGEPQKEEEEVAAAAAKRSLPVAVEESGPRQLEAPDAAEVPQATPGGGGGQEGREEQEDSRSQHGEPEPGSGETPPEDDSAAAASGVAPAAAPATTPRCARKNFRERMLGSSPQLKRGGGLAPRGSRSTASGGDSDSASLASSSAEDEGGSNSGASVALDPLEHAWMLCASDGRWESLEGLLSCEPSLLCKRDFITGFTCVHWAAKHGRHELLALLVNFAQRHRLPVDVNARTSGGYTALHLAAMHGHLEVVKLLVGAYDADVDVRDYSGRKAAHYLSRSTADEVRSLVGALQDEADGGATNGSGRWRLSKVLPANLISYKLSHHLLPHHGDDGETGDGAGAPGKAKELSRKTSGSGRIKPRLNKIRFRTQIIHTTPSFRGDAEEEGQEERSLKSSFKLRPKSNVFG